MADLESLFYSDKNLATVAREIKKACKADFDHIKIIARDPYYKKLIRKIENSNDYKFLMQQLDLLNYFFIDDYKTMFGCSIPKDKIPVLKTPDDYRKVNLTNDVKVFFYNGQWNENNSLPRRGENVGNYRRYLDKGGFVEGMPGMREYDTISVTNRVPYHTITDEIYDPTPNPRFHTVWKWY